MNRLTEVKIETEKSHLLFHFGLLMDVGNQKHRDGKVKCTRCDAGYNNAAFTWKQAGSRRQTGCHLSE